MKIVYLDSEYMCHLEDGDGRTEAETDVFDDIVDEAIPYYRYIPIGHEWTDEYGRVRHGIFVQATNSNAIDKVTQAVLIAEMQTALSILGVTEE